MVQFNLDPEGRTNPLMWYQLGEIKAEWIRHPRTGQRVLVLSGPHADNCWKRVQDIRAAGEEPQVFLDVFNKIKWEATR